MLRLHNRAEPIESRRVGTGSNPTRLRIGLFGCPLDTGNSGVTALALATVRGLSRPGIPIDLTIFDHGRGERVTRLPIDNGQMDVRQVGCYSSRRYYRVSNLTQIHVAAHLGLRHLHPILSIVGELDAVLDISGGDSFSDIYGIRQFRSQCLPKLIALQLGLPLVLLPQTFGPYKLATAQSAARSILRRASQVWTRDARSYQVARTLLNGTG